MTMDTMTVSLNSRARLYEFSVNFLKAGDFLRKENEPLSSRVRLSKWLIEVYHMGWGW